MLGPCLPVLLYELFCSLATLDCFLLALLAPPSHHCRRRRLSLGNDAPLASFIDEGMPFVSVAPTEEACPPQLRPMHVGGLEEGTAECLVRHHPILHAHSHSHSVENALAIAVVQVPCDIVQCLHTVP